MIKKINLITPIMGLLLLSSASSFASQPTLTDKKNSVSQNSNDELQKIIDDFSSYAATIPPEIREEVKKYRIEIAKINNQKRELYKKISQEAQNYLAKEQEYKKRMSALRKKSAGVQDNSVINDEKSKQNSTK